MQDKLACQIKSQDYRWRCLLLPTPVSKSFAPGGSAGTQTQKAAAQLLPEQLATSTLSSVGLCSFCLVK